MKAGGDSIGAVEAPSDIDFEGPKPTVIDKDYALGTFWAAAGTGLMIGSAYTLATDGPLTGVGLAGAGVGFGLWSIAAFRGHRGDGGGDAAGRKLHLGGAYLATLGTAMLGGGLVWEAHKKDEGTPFAIGIGLAAAGAGLFGYTLYSDWHGAKQERRPGLFWEAAAHLSIGPHGVAAAVQF
ncbi:MAG: hypothetical protein HY466_01865 [Deltaproteobacteria bacterium]|nr:hypothetical protein [Deltaproteobacteria bacterium]